MSDVRPGTPGHRAFRAGQVIIVLALVVFALLAYVLAVGPTAYVAQKGIISPRAYHTAFLPVHAIAERDANFQTVFNRYLRWWMLL